MPASHGISVRLESQFDIALIPEFLSSAAATNHAVHQDSEHTDALSGSSEDHVSQTSTTQQLEINDNSTSPIIDVHAPSYPSSQFWVTYDITPSAIPSTDAEIKFIYFKLMFSNRCVVSWGVGAEQDWKGKTMWAFYRGEDHGAGWRTIEKKGFFFRDAGDQDFEIQVFRARRRRRVSREFEDEISVGERDFELVDFGRLKEHHPQRFYQYALLDGVDSPCVIFRYHLRSWEYLKQMNIAGPDGILHSASNSSGSYFSASQEPSGLDEELPESDGDDTSSADKQQTYATTRRLSFPPSIRLLPSTSTPEPYPPEELANETTSEEPAHKDREDDASSVDTVIRRRWIVRTPSPFKSSDGDNDSTASSGKKQKSGTGSLRRVIGNALRRKGGERLSPSSSLTAPRSASVSPF